MGRIIFLVDMNAFFISCETSRNPDLSGKPAAVAGDPKNRSGIVLTANYEARKYGVKTTMLVHEAQKLCPGIIFVKPDHAFYEEKSHKVMELLSGYTPLLQQNSIDEAWMDMTGTEYLFGTPLEAAELIMKDIKEKLGLMCSIGISENKFLSKMASEMKKPMGITELVQRDIKEKLWPLPVRSMYGVGRQTEKKLREISINTIGDLARGDKTLLYDIFGKYGTELVNLSNGIDNSPVEAEPVHDSKSISRSTTLPKDISDIDEARVVLLKLSEEVGMEARKNGFKGTTISIALKYNDFSSITRQKSVKATYLTSEIYNTGLQLLEKNWSCRAVRLIGIGLGSTGGETVEQLSIFQNDEMDNEGRKEENLEKALDSIRIRYGMDKIKRAKVLDKNT